MYDFIRYDVTRYMTEEQLDEDEWELLGLPRRADGASNDSCTSNDTTTYFIIITTLGLPLLLFLLILF